MDRRQMLLAPLAAPLFGQTASSAGVTRQFYELRWFFLRNGNHAPRMMDLLKNYWAPAAKRAGVQSPGFFQPSIGEGSPSVLMLSAFNSADDASAAWDRMMSDSEFSTAYKRAQHPEPAFEQMEATLLRAFAGMPSLHEPPPLENGGSRIFELRTYQSNSMASLRTKLDMFNSGEIGVFQRVGMLPVFFGEAVFGRDLPHLTYMLSYESLAARERLWKDFIADAEFTKLRSEPGFSDAEIVSNISNAILSPTSFSQIR